MCINMVQEAVQLGSISAVFEFAGCGATDLRDKLEARVLTEDWLQAFLGDDEVAAVHRLSVFAGSFDAAGAASVAFCAGEVMCQHVFCSTFDCGSRACAARGVGVSESHCMRDLALADSPRHAAAMRLLSRLHTVSVLQKVPGRDSGGVGASSRFCLHPLVRGTAEGMLAARGPAERLAVRAAFAAFMLSRAGKAGGEDRAASPHLATQQATGDDALNWCELARLLPRLVSEGALAPVQLHSCLGLAALARERGRLAAAEALGRAGLQAHEELLGRVHLDAVRARGDLAATLHVRGRLDEAEGLQRGVLRDLEHALGPGHPDVVHARAPLAATLCARGQLHEAQALEKRLPRVGLAGRQVGEGGRLQKGTAPAARAWLARCLCL